MPEMATLDAFFNKIERPVSLSTAAEHGKCKTSDNDKKLKDAPRKRGRDGESSAKKRRLQSQRHKPRDSNLNVSDCASEVAVASEIASDCQTCSQNEVEDENAPSSAIEISYEEFLTSTGIAHVETSLGCSEDAESDAETKVKMSPIKTPLKHGALDVESEMSVSPVKTLLKHRGSAGESLPKSLKKKEQSPDDDEGDKDVLCNGSEVASKDIRSFFSKAENVCQPVSAATLMKVKADVHCEQSEKRSVPLKCTESHIKMGKELARMQRAAIVITDDDLDIEVIDVDVSKSDEDLQVEDSAVDTVTVESSSENHMLVAAFENASNVCSEVLLNTDNGRKSVDEQEAVVVGNVNAVENSAKSRRERKLSAFKFTEASREAKVHTPEEAVIHDNCDPGVHKDKCSDDSDKVIMVDEMDHKAGDCSNLSATEPSAASIPEKQCDLLHAKKSIKPLQVRHFEFMFKLTRTVKFND